MNTGNIEGCIEAIFLEPSRNDLAENTPIIFDFPLFYSPQIRNTKQMLEKRGKLSPSYPKLQQFSKRREAKRSK